MTKLYNDIPAWKFADAITLLYMYNHRAYQDVGDVTDRGNTGHFWCSARLCRLRAAKKRGHLISMLITSIQSLRSSSVV